MHVRPIRLPVWTWLLCLPAAVVGCAEPSVYTKLQSDAPADRIGGIVQAARENRTDALPYLVDRLSDTEPEVRLFAAVALRRMTGESFGYRHYAAEAERDRAVVAWRDWLERRADAATQTSVPRGSTVEARP